MPVDYNATLNLPKTDFPMRAALAQREPAMLEKLYADDTYAELCRKNADKTPYILHDGPPFSNGNIHIGTALNKILKDFVLRYKAMTGYYTPYKPGWDNHGMPIESAIIKKNKLDRKKMSIPEFRNACRDFAWDFVEKQREQFKRLGVLGDWDHPYLTMDPAFEAEEIKVFGKMYEKGYIYKGLKPVYWCPQDETALAEAEIEYQEDPCTSIYVKFRVADDQGKLADPQNTYFVIWTTTTWTLPGNLAIALNPAESYVAAKVPNGERYIVAEALLEKTMQMGGVSDYEIAERFTGRELEYLTAQHPFLDRKSLVVLADYVTMDSGTGCVHTAPGFGADDYQTGRRYGLEMLVPVDDRGYQTEAAGKFAGMRYDESNAAILADLKETGALFASEEITHTYPHCWRCKNPIIFRATPQWFCSVDAFKDETVDAIRKVQWLPAWGEERIIGMVRERADWCISRQRHWGLPIPVFYCADCGKPVCNEESIAAVSALFGEKGSNSWYELEAEDILPGSFRCPHCGGVHFTKETDTLDGWFDSGSTHIASLKKDDPTHWPADLYLEGADQYRGWFQSSLLIAVGALGGGAPYKRVITHGWTVDGEGKAMHKSLGNAVAPEEVIKVYGADMLRLWVASSDYQVDVRVSDAILKQLSQAYLKIRNTARYILGNLAGFDANNLAAPEEMTEIDRWALTKLAELTAKVREGYENYSYHMVYHAIYNFCVVELSNFYLDVIKDRLYCDGRDSISRRAAQTAIYHVLNAITLLLGPILSFTADEIWQAMPHTPDQDPRNVCLNDMPAADPLWTLAPEEESRWELLLRLRADVNKALELARGEKLIGKPLDARVTLYLSGEAAGLLRNADAGELAKLCIVSEMYLREGEGDGVPGENVGGLTVHVEPSALPKCLRCWTRDPSVGTDREFPELCARCADAIR